MWKYQCKKQLMYILIAFVVGAFLFGVMGYQKDYIMKTLETVTTDKAILANPYILYIVGGMIAAGFTNGLTLLMYVIQRFNINYLFVLVLLLVGGVDIAIMIGTAGLIPCIAVYIFGWLTIPNRGKQGGFKKGNNANIQEMERVYRLHHTYDDQYEEMGKKAHSGILTINIIYAIGLIGLFLVCFYVENFAVVMLAMLLYFMLFYQLTRRKNAILQPMIGLLYDDCNPEACATAIFAYAKQSKFKKEFPLPQQLAQCMIYLNDPHLAIEVLATCKNVGQNRGGFAFAYHSLMSYAYYQLGDESMVKHHYEECNKIGNTNMNGPMGIVRSQSLQAIQNKLDMMQKNFTKSEVFYRNMLHTTPFEFQRVDAQYFLGLINFVQRSVDSAERSFQYVSEHGKSMHYKQKADAFLKTIEAMPKEEY